MERKNLEELLQHNAYPGRGIVTGRSEDGQYAVIAYFIMGRSTNSRNRVFVTDGDGIRTKAYDESLLTDPSLIIYAPVRVLGQDTIVTNGDQTDTAVEGLRRGLSFEEALRIRTFEPDGPNWTPRISARVHVEQGTLLFEQSILKSADGDPEGAERFTFAYENPKAGEGRFIHTYLSDGDPLPSFEGEPERVALSGGIDEFTEKVWQSLNADNRVSLFTRYIALADGSTQSRIVNRNE